MFDIEQGVAITVLIKLQENTATSAALDLFGNTVPSPRLVGSELPRKAQVHHADLWGSREYKYQWLQSSAWADAPWRTLTPQTQLLLFVPVGELGRQSYEEGWKVTDIFPVNTTGIVTARDSLALDFTNAELETKIAAFLKPDLGDDEVRLRTFGHGAPGAKYPAGDSRGWKLGRARNELRLIDWKKSIAGCLYRPFDHRAMLYDKRIVDWGRWEVMGQLVGRAGSLYLGACRQMNGDQWAHMMVGEGLVESCFISNRTSEIGSVFPLWLRPAGKPSHPNIAPAFLQALATSLGVPTDPERYDMPHAVEPEHVLAYVYAVLHAHSYRSRYAEFLKSDFPRIPIAAVPGSALPFAQVWTSLLPLGRELISLHLLRQVPSQLSARFPVAGDNAVEKPRYVPGADPEQGRVYINATQYFDGVPPATWAFRIGGYQVCDKWLKDRKGRTLTLADVEHYSRVVAALSATRKLMAQVDVAANGVLWGVEPKTGAAACT